MTGVPRDKRGSHGIISEITPSSRRTSFSLTDTVCHSSQTVTPNSAMEKCGWNHSLIFSAIIGAGTSPRSQTSVMDSTGSFDVTKKKLCHIILLFSYCATIPTPSPSLYGKELFFSFFLAQKKKRIFEKY